VYVESDNTIYSCDNEGEWHQYGIGNVVGTSNNMHVLRYSGGDWVTTQLAVTYSEIENSAVIAGKLGVGVVDGGVSVNNIIDGELTTDNFYDNAITEVKTADNLGLILSNTVVLSGYSSTTPKFLSLNGVCDLIGVGGIGIFDVAYEGYSSNEYAMDYTEHPNRIKSGCSYANISEDNTARLISPISTTNGVYWWGAYDEMTTITLVGYIKFRGTN
jgi:hypothetical protein